MKTQLKHQGILTIFYLYFLPSFLLYVNLFKNYREIIYID